MKMKRTLAVLFAVCMMMAMSTTAFAADNSSWYGNISSGWSVGTGSGWSWGNWGNGSGWNWGDWGGTNPGGGSEEVEENVLAAPSIIQCRYIHQKLYTSDCLSVSWEEVEGAASYEMEMSNSDYEVIKTYTTTSARKYISANSGDDAVKGCVRGNKIRVRAIDENGNCGKWSEYKTVGCNALVE